MWALAIGNEARITDQIVKEVTSAMNNVKINGDRLSVNFRAPFDLEAYEMFLRCKTLPEFNLDYCWQSDSYTMTAPARFASMLGVKADRERRPNLPFNPELFDYQFFFTDVALEAKRYALWFDTGLGKTAVGLEFARQVAHRTGGRVLIVTPLNILEQWRDEARHFYGEGLQIEHLDSRAHLRQWCDGPADGRIAITNPEKFIPRDGEDQKVSEVNKLAGVVLDESSLLKSGGGVIKWAMIHSCRGVEYKLSLTATPAPNDTMEYASQASFLEKLRSEGDVLWTYFIRDKQGNWKVKDHARDAFYRFMSSWSCYLRNPANYGFADNLKGLPAPEILIHRIEPTPEQLDIARYIARDDGQGLLFGADKMGVVGRAEASQAAKGFRYLKGGSGSYREIESRKPAFVADLIRQEVAAGRQVLVWTLFDAETEILAGHLFDVPGIEYLTGKVKKDDRIPMIERFRKGETRVLVSRASMLGFGLNFQFCTSMVFSGFSDSYEQYYQAIRRIYRYGQKETVRIHIPYIKELEGVIWDNIQDKQAAWERDTDQMEAAYINAMKHILREEAA